MADTPRLDLPYLAASQAQKEVYLNVSLDRLDLLVQCAVLDRNLTTPPASPTSGDAYIIASGATGVWAGHTNALALWVNSQWEMIAPLPGFLCWVLDEAVLVTWTGSLWQTVTTGGGGAGTFLALTDTPDTYSGQAGKAVLVNPGATGLEFGTTGGGAPPDATYVVSSANATLTAERVLTDTAQIVWDNATAGQVKATLAAHAVQLSHLAQLMPGYLLGRGDPALGDVQPILVGSGLQLLDATLSNTSPAGATTFLALSDTPDSYSGQAGKVVQVKGDASGLEFAASSSTPIWERVDPGASTLTTGLLAFWRMEETSGNRVDSVASLALVPQGTVAQITAPAGKHGTAVRFNGTAGTYLSLADNPTISVGAAQSFTVACWVYFEAAPSADVCLVGKGDASISYGGAEYQLWYRLGALHFSVGNNSGYVDVNSTVNPTAGAWYFLIGWWDSAAGQQYIQVNNGTPVALANTNGSFDSGGGLEIGRIPGWSSSPTVNARVDDVMFYKRVLTTSERTSLWNGGNGLDYPDLGGGTAYLHPVVRTDRVLAGATTLTATEPLESAGGVKLGTSTGTTAGIVRWTGTDFEGRTSTGWVSLTTLTVSATDRLLGRVSAGAGLVEEIVCTAAGRAILDDADAAAQRTTLGLGTLATQDANAVAITGGVAQFGGKATPYWLAAPNAQIDFLFGPLRMYDNLTVDKQIHVGSPSVGNPLTLTYDRTYQGLVLIPSIDTGGGAAVYFLNAAQTVNVGSITTTATTTAFNTSSDVRLKHNVHPLTGSLDLLRRLNPISHLWNVDDSYAENFLAHELQQVLPYAVSGEPDAVNDDGSVKPQQVDASKIIPRMVGAIKELLAQVDALTARVTALETALGV